MPDDIESTSTGASSPAPEKAVDQRLYVPDHKTWDVRVKRGSDNEYCYMAAPGQDYFHLLLDGEIYVQRGNEKFCLNCAFRQGAITLDRLFWQTRVFPP